MHIGGFGEGNYAHYIDVKLHMDGGKVGPCWDTIGGGYGCDIKFGCQCGRIQSCHCLVENSCNWW